MLRFKNTKDGDKVYSPAGVLVFTISRYVGAITDPWLILGVGEFAGFAARAADPSAAACAAHDRYVETYGESLA